MPPNSISRRTVITAAAAATVATALPVAASAAPAAQAFDAARVVAEIEALEDRDAAFKALSAHLRDRFGLMLIHDHVVSHAIAVLEAHVDPTDILHVGDVEHYTKMAIIDLKEAQTGQELRRRIIRIDF